MKNKLYILIVLMIAAISARGQDYSLDAIKQIGLKKGITANGSFSLSTVAYTAKGIAYRRDPFNWFATGSLNLNLFGIAAPLSFSYTNAQLNYSQPFNRIRIIPQYKWMKLYLGKGNMNFNEYTLAGHVFNGYGIELTPKKFKLMAMAGSLQDAVPYTVQSPATMAFKRKAFGFLAGINKQKWAVELSTLQAKDDAHSVPVIPAVSTVFPQSNLTVSLKTRAEFTRWFRIEAMYAQSALTADNRDSISSENSTQKVSGKYGLISSIFHKNTTTSYFDAIDVSAGFTFPKFNLQLKYRRVAPGYASLGAYYVNNDLENITAAPSFILWKGKVNISANVGMQRNNLDRSKASSDKRLVVSGNVAVNPNQHWSFNTAFSNFTMHTRTRPQSDPYFVNGLDSLNYYQINQTLTQMVMYNLGDKDTRQSFLLTVSYQQAQDHTNATTSTTNTSNFFTSNFSYTYNKTKQALTSTLSVNYYSNHIQGVQTNYIGPTVTLTKAFLDKKLPVNMSLTYNTTTMNGANAGNVINGKLGTTYVMKEGGKRENKKLEGGSKKPVKPGMRSNKLFTKPKHSFNCNIQYTNKAAYSNEPAYSEWTVNAGYVMNF